MAERVPLREENRNQEHGAPAAPLPPSASWKKFFIIETGKTNGAHQSVVGTLKSRRQTETTSPEDADYCLVFCPVFSRVGTDVDDALQRLPGDKAAVLVVMHHTFNRQAVIPPSSRLVKDRRVRLTLDCLFYQNRLLSCQFNKKMKTEIKKNFRHSGSKFQRFCSCFKIICCRSDVDD